MDLGTSHATNLCCTLSTERKHFGNVMTQTSSKARDKRKKFEEIATRRVNGVIKEIRLIGNLSNRAAYEFTEEDVRKITKALQRELDVMRARFEGPGKGNEPDFSL
jgi:hypothetical protein